MDKCKKNGVCNSFLRGPIARVYYTGDKECDARSTEYECGGIYNKNYMDKIGEEEHLCFWNCKGCKL